MTGLWGGRFRGGMADSMVPLNRSLSVDYRLWPQDIRGSQAWAQGLVRAGVLTAEEGNTLRSGLEKVGEALNAKDFSDAPDEDIHSLVERLLAEEVGPVAGKLHTGRSRNDQVSTDFRLWGMEAAHAVTGSLHDLLGSFITLAEASLEIILPGHTHLQQAQPVRGAHWALSHFWPLLRDRDRFRQVGHAASSLPLGSGALAGCPFPVDRDWLREVLGFQRISENSLDAVSDRDWAAEMAFAGALLGVHLSRIGEDLVLFSSREFGYVKLPEGYCTGSSLMPQKRNPDAAELVRGKAGRLLGNLTGFLTLLKGLPTGYNRDLQEDKEILFDTVDTLMLVLPVMSEVAKGIEFQEDTIKKRLDPELLATDIADYLVRKGVPFRESHQVVGELVRTGEEGGTPLSRLPLQAFQKVHSAFEEDVFRLFSFEASVEARNLPGGTARGAVRIQLEQAGRALTR
ncbi:MAG: argininosuccinate lyase [Gemmatimonadota bacterium]